MKNEAIWSQQEKLPYGNEHLNIESILAQAKLAQDFIKDWSDIKINKIITDINDIIKNNKKIFNIIKKILKEKTKLKSIDINNINKKYLILNPNQAKEYGICHKIIEI